MLGAEAFLVLAVISSIVTIIDGTKQVYDAAASTEGLPKAFNEIADRLPIIRNVLRSAKEHIEKEDVEGDSCKGVEPVVKACENKAKKLDELFRKVIPADGASRPKRYWAALKTTGKGNKVEDLMKGMLEDVQLLFCEHGMKMVTEAEQEQVTKAIADVSAIPPSVPEGVFQETGFMANKFDLGNQTNYNAHGEYIAQGETRQYNSAGGVMKFGKD